MDMHTIAAAVLVASALAGCESMGTAAQSKQTQGAVLGGLLGAGTGAIIGNQSDHAGAGTAIGAGLGALGGGLLGNAMEERDRAAERQVMPPASTSTAPITSPTKFCPVGGETFPDSIKYCPTHGVELRLKEQ
jgi:uncharacterized membrane protein YebE (DUF533 family)